ncbi:MAG: Ldh family oxidoreductase [Rhodocyclales bacterium]|nr:Ldh family oxidoreductase [Rhodocyclales bacterium]
MASARALLYGESRRLRSDGLARVAQYAGHLKSGRVNGRARIRVENCKAAACLIDADEGLALLTALSSSKP